MFQWEPEASDQGKYCSKRDSLRDAQASGQETLQYVTPGRPVEMF